MLLISQFRMRVYYSSICTNSIIEHQFLGFSWFGISITQEIDFQLLEGPSEAHIGGGIFKKTDKFKGIAMVTVRDGKSCFLWHDLWDGRICSQVFPI